MDNKGNRAAQKVDEKSPGTKFKDIKNSDCSDREFKMTVKKKVDEIQENSEMQFNELRYKFTQKEC